MSDERWAEDRVRSWQHAAISYLVQIADIDSQRSYWLCGEGCAISSPSELLCQLFDDTGLGILLDEGRLAFDPVVDQMLLRLNRLADRVDYGAPPDVLLSSKSWHDVVDLARQVLIRIGRRDQVN